MKIAKLQWSFKKSTDAPFVVDVSDAPTQAFLMEMDTRRFPTTGGWGYALFNHVAASDDFTTDPSPADCGHACHVAVKGEDYLFHPSRKRLSVRAVSCRATVRDDAHGSGQTTEKPPSI